MCCLDLSRCFLYVSKPGCFTDGLIWIAVILCQAKSWWNVAPILGICWIPWALDGTKSDTLSSKCSKLAVDLGELVTNTVDNQRWVFQWSYKESKFCITFHLTPLYFTILVLRLTVWYILRIFLRSSDNTKFHHLHSKFINSSPDPGQNCRAAPHSRTLRIAATMLRRRVVLAACRALGTCSRSPAVARLYERRCSNKSAKSLCESFTWY